MVAQVYSEVMLVKAYLFLLIDFCLKIFYEKRQRYRKVKTGTSLVAQWLRICLPMQGTRLRALVREDPTSRRATKPMCHNY